MRHPEAEAVVMERKWVFISVGSNMGDALQNCRRGIESLCAGDTIHQLAISRFYRTEPVDYRDQNWFVNAAVKIDTCLEPLALLDRLRSIQEAFGRKDQAIRFGPRLLDLDIIFYEDLVLDSPRLIIPHPRMHKRRFVLQPICDIDPAVMHPVLQLDVKTLLERLIVEDQEIVPCSNS